LIQNLELCDIADVVEVLEANDQLKFPEVDGPEAMKRVKACTAAIFLVYETGGRVVGAVRGNYDGSRAIIHQLTVHPGYQRRGIGTALVKEIVRSFQRIGAPTVSAMVTEGSLPFWQKVGFRKTKTFLVGNW
jgi:ribosomal protein S18 acetylase RimI-like enzyme